MSLFSATAALFLTAGCNDPSIVPGPVAAGSTIRTEQNAFVEPDEPPATETKDTVSTETDAVGSKAPAETVASSEKPIVVPVEGSTPVNSKPAETSKAAVAAPLEDRTFRSEGPEQALRVSFDDLDLLKILKMDPVTNDCVGKMPPWLKGLNGKKVRIRGFMKPGLVMTGIPQFMFVRDTGLCCFGPKGKIYDMIATTLKPPATTDYIELRPFDVVGTFRIELLEEDGLIFGLYYLDDAQIIQR